jgi:DNA-binding CsgD family transcriptional regulator
MDLRNRSRQVCLGADLGCCDGGLRLHWARGDGIGGWLDLMIEDELQRGRDAYRGRAWTDAHAILSRMDQERRLGAEDLERLAMAAYLTNQNEDCLATLERCHSAYRNLGEHTRAVRAAFWLGFRLASTGETGPANGWFARGARLLEGAADCVEAGYLLLPTVERHLARGDWEAADASATEAAAIGARFHDADLVACALHQEGRALIRKGEIEAGLTLLDEAMVAVVADELSPLMTGLIYCSVILACREVFALDRARQWTSALARWCRDQPQIVAFTGSCLVHRAEILQLEGAWPEAFAAAGQVCKRFREGIDPQPPAAAFYQRAEMHRLRGAFAAAEADYRRASGFGCEPQPGLALLRLAQGDAAAAAAMARVLGATADPLRRARLLPALVEIALAAGDVEEAERACGEFEEFAAVIGRGVPEAIAAGARGAVLLAQGEAAAALRVLRHSLEVWQVVGAPYETARVRSLIGRACRALADDDGAELEFAAARATFENLGARPDLAHLDALAAARGRTDSHRLKQHGLTRRELQVLRLVSTGSSNAAIAAELSLSQRTVERHLSNIFTKLDLKSRTAAAAWTYRHGLV